MEFLLFIAGVGVGSVFWIAAIRRASKKPDGNTGKLIKIMGGGGGGPDPSTK
jgi:hypothetical protein